MRTLHPVILTLFLVALGALAVPRHSPAQGNAPAPPGQAIDSTKNQSNICELHRASMSKRTVPIAYGMIPMSGVEAERGEWKRRTDYHPHPGDCLPSTSINLTGEKRAVVFVCPKCESAKKEMESERPARMTVAAQPQDPILCEAVVQKYEASTMQDHMGGAFRIYDAVVLKILSPARKAGQEVRVYLEAGVLPADSALRKRGRTLPVRLRFRSAQAAGSVVLGCLEESGTSGNQRCRHGGTVVEGD